MLINYIKWASVSASLGASQGKSKDGGIIDDDTNVTLAPLPESENKPGAGGVF